MKIAIDVDGVILDLMGEFCQIYNERFGTNYSKEDANNWDFYKDWEMSLEFLTDTFRYLHENPMRTPLIDRAAPEIMKVLQLTHETDIITSREAHTRKALIKRLDSLEIYKDSHYTNILITPLSPTDVKLRYDFDIFIDDNPNLGKSINNYENKILLLYSQPWNYSVQNAPKVVRVNNWNEILGYLKKQKEI
jgi:uncharacterized HAD superfamily protein